MLVHDSLLGNVVLAQAVLECKVEVVTVGAECGTVPAPVVTHIAQSRVPLRRARASEVDRNGEVQLPRHALSVAVGDAVRGDEQDGPVLTSQQRRVRASAQHSVIGDLQ